MTKSKFGREYVRKAKRAAKSQALRLALRFGAESSALHQTSSHGVILFSHRVATRRGDPGFEIDALTLRTVLSELLETGRYTPVHLDSLFDPGVHYGQDRGRLLAITFDDGYRDQLEVAGPVLRDLGVPATLFVTTGFIDKEIWMWWDQIEWLVQEAGPSAVLGCLEKIRDDHPDGALGALGSGDVVQNVCEWMKGLPDPERRRVLKHLPRDLEILIPTAAPPRYAPADWALLREWELSGTFRIAPHSHTHPILSRMTDDESRREISLSWRRLREELASPLPVFAFPNGRPVDFGMREQTFVREEGLWGAVSTQPGLADLTQARRKSGDIVLPRYTLPTDGPRARVVASGWEALRHGRLSQGQEES